MELILQVMKNAKTNGIRDLLKDPNSILKLFLCTMKLNNAGLLSRFASLLDNFLNTKPQEGIKGQEESVVEEIRALLVYHIQAMLKWLIKYSKKTTRKEILSNIIKDQINTSTWLEYLTFSLDQLIVATEKVNEIKPKEKKIVERKKSTIRGDSQQPSSKQDIDLPKPGMPRSISLSKEEKTREISVDNIDKSGNIPLDIVTSLIELLFPNDVENPGYNFSTSTKAWSLVMKTVLKVDTSTLIKAKVFENLVNSFLVASEDIQQIMFTEIVKLTQNMIQNQTYQKELCANVLNVLFSTLNNLQGDRYEPIIFSLLKGWLDILLTKDSPKPESYLNKPSDVAFCKLNL